MVKCAWGGEGRHGTRGGECGVLFGDGELSGNLGNWRGMVFAPRPCPLPRPNTPVRSVAQPAALGEGGCGFRAWCLYLMGLGARL